MNTDISEFGYRELELAIEQLQFLLKTQKQSGKLNAFSGSDSEINICFDENTGEVGFTDGVRFWQFE